METLHKPLFYCLSIKLWLISNRQAIFHSSILPFHPFSSGWCYSWCRCCNRNIEQKWIMGLHGYVYVRAVRTQYESTLNACFVNRDVLKIKIKIVPASQHCRPLRYLLKADAQWDHPSHRAKFTLIFRRVVQAIKDKLMTHQQAGVSAFSRHRVPIFFSYSWISNVYLVPLRIIPISRFRIYKCGVWTGVDLRYFHTSTLVVVTYGSELDVGWVDPWVG